MWMRLILVAALVLGWSHGTALIGHTEFRAAVPRLDVQAVVASLHRLPYALPSNPTSDAEIRRLAEQAYVWGWPLVYLHNCRAALENVPTVGRSGGMPVAPPNQLCMLTDYISPKQNLVACPNQDVVYGFGVLDLSVEPVVVQVPDFGDRFWIYQLGDQRTDGFAAVGKMHGTRPGAYLVVGPDWNGSPPAGIAAVFRCPTRLGYCLPRVYLDDTADDRRAVQPVINQIMAYPLSRFDGRMKTTDWSKVRWLPQIAGRGGKQSRWVSPTTYFDVLGDVLDEVPPLAGEEPLYAQFRALLAAARRDVHFRSVLLEAATAAEERLVAPLFEFQNVGVQVRHFWNTIDNGAAFGTDYLTRTAVAKSNIFVNRNDETKYFYQDFDAAGRPLDGSKSYRITFPAGALPPTDGFWSLTLYDERHAFYANELNRHSLGTKSKRLRYDADGSLTICIQNEPPAADEQANWLPAPAGRFSLYLRAYGPQTPILTGAWQPPAVVAIASRGDIGE